MKRRPKTGRRVPCQAKRPDHVRSYDFQEDGLLSRRKLRLLNVVDEFTREWLSVTVGVSLTSGAVLPALKPRGSTESCATRCCWTARSSLPFRKRRRA